MFMKVIQRETRSNLSRYLREHLASILSAFLVATGWGSEVAALGGAVGSGLNPAEMSRAADSGLAISTSNQVLDAVQSGVYQRIIAAMELSSGNSIEGVGISWMVLGSPSQAAIFTPLGQSSTRPETSTSSNKINLEDESHSAGRLIEVAASPSSLHRLATSGTNTTTSAVDLMTTMTQGDLSSLIDGFYSASVIDRSLDPEMPPTRPVAPEGAALATGLHTPPAAEK